MEMLEGDAFNQEYYFEEITDKSDANLETSKNKNVHSKMSEGDVENLETIDESEAFIRSFQDLPDELIPKSVELFRAKRRHKIRSSIQETKKNKPRQFIVAKSTLFQFSH